MDVDLMDPPRNAERRVNQRREICQKICPLNNDGVCVHHQTVIKLGSLWFRSLGIFLIAMLPITIAFAGGVLKLNSTIVEAITVAKQNHADIVEIRQAVERLAHNRVPRRNLSHPP